MQRRFFITQAPDTCLFFAFDSNGTCNGRETFLEAVEAAKNAYNIPQDEECIFEWVDWDKQRNAVIMAPNSTSLH